jgi:hypothetical protein
MPCTITGTLEGDRELFAKEEIAGLEKSLRKSQAERLKLTQMLCWMCREYGHVPKPGTGKQYCTLPPDIREWWEKHKKQDAKYRRRVRKK